MGTPLRCAVLCCAVLCCAVLCCAVLCCAVLCCTVLCCHTGALAPFVFRPSLFFLSPSLPPLSLCDFSGLLCRACPMLLSAVRRCYLTCTRISGRSLFARQPLVFCMAALPNFKHSNLCNLVCCSVSFLWSVAGWPSMPVPCVVLHVIEWFS